MGVSGQGHASSALYPHERAPGTHWLGGWLGPRAGLDTEARGKILSLCWRSHPGHPVSNQTLCRLSYPQLPSEFGSIHNFLILSEMSIALGPDPLMMNVPYFCSLHTVAHVFIPPPPHTLTSQFKSLVVASGVLET
jgi:hypothetical protein